MDVVAAGPERPPRRRAGLVVGVAATVLVAAGLAVSARDAVTPDPAPTQPAPARPGPAVTVAPVVPPVVTEPVPEPLAGRETREVTGRAVVVGLGTVSVVDLRTGRVRPLDLGGEPVRHALPVGRSVVLHGGDGIGDFPPPASAVFAVDPSLRVRRLGTAGAVVADATGTGIWATTWNARGTAATTRHVDLSGRAGRQYPLGGTEVVRAEVRGGRFVTEDLDAGGLEVWDKRANRRVHREPYASFVAATADRLVWGEDDYAGTCRLAWFDMPNEFGGDGYCYCGVVEARVESFPHVALLSPDGKWLALQTTHERVSVTICPVGRGRCVAPRNAVSDEIFELAWTPDSATLLLGTSPRVGQLAAWRPGWRDLRLVPGRHDVVSLAAVGP